MDFIVNQICRFEVDNKLFALLMKVEVMFISVAEDVGWGWQPLPRPWLLWIKQKPNLITVLLHIERKNESHVFPSLLKQQKAREVDMITRDLARVLQSLDNAIHRLNHYPADSVVCFVNTYTLDSDLSAG